MNYIARKCDFVPRHDIEMAYADMFANQFTDIYNAASAAFLDTNATSQAIANANLLNNTWPLTLKRAEARILANGCGVLAGRDISYADIYLSTILDLVGNNRDNLIMAYPNVKALDARVRAMPKIANWIKNRPVTPL